MVNEIVYTKIRNILLQQFSGYYPLTQFYLNGIFLDFPRGIDHVDSVEFRRGATMGYRTYLAWLTFTIKKRAIQAIIFFITDSRAGIPEFLCIRLVSRIFYHANHFPIFNFQNKAGC